ncbi:MAG: hypothetical protein Rubg2KO_15250 [Rubricoccaceae bacterium]
MDADETMDRVLQAVLDAGRPVSAGYVRGVVPDVPRGTVNSYLRRLHESGRLAQEKKKGPYSAPVRELADAQRAVHEVDTVYVADGGRTGKDAVPEVEVLTYSAGNGATAIGRAVPSVTRTRKEIERMGFKPDAIELIHFDGYSMWPLIAPNSFGFGLPMDRFDGPGVYAFEFDGHRIVKDVDVLLGGILRVSARNKEAFPDAEELEPVRDDGVEPNTYRSRLSGTVARVDAIRRVVGITQVT